MSLTFSKEVNNQNPDARVRIKCRCGNQFVALIPITLVRTWQTHKCTQCSQRFKTHYLEPSLGGKGWTIYAEGTVCDLCHVGKPPLKDALDGAGHIFHLCEGCFEDQQKKSEKMGPIKTGFYRG